MSLDCLEPHESSVWVKAKSDKWTCRNIINLIYASIAVHRIRKYGLAAGSSGQNTRLPSEHELGSRRASPAASASTTPTTGEPRAEELEIV